MTGLTVDNKNVNCTISINAVVSDISWSNITIMTLNNENISYNVFFKDIDSFLHSNSKNVFNFASFVDENDHALILYEYR